MRTETQQKKAVTFVLAEREVVKGSGSHEQSLRSLPESHNSSRRENETEHNVLPLNFFHSPGEYNRMLIRASVVTAGSVAEGQMGLVRNLQFMNEPIFAAEVQERNKRIREYCHNRKLKSAQTVGNEKAGDCGCCCCDNYCAVCANETSCEQSERGERPKGKLLIDIEGMKRGEVKRVKKSLKPQQKLIQPSTYVREVERHNDHRVNKLITASLVKQIQGKRRKQLIELEGERRKEGLKMYNMQVRSINRSVSAPKPQQLHKSTTNYQLRSMYWNSKKELIASELKKEAGRCKQSKISAVQECHKRRMLSGEEMLKLRILHEQQALMEENMAKLKKEHAKKVREKKLLALAAEQAEIVKNCPSRQFRPSPALIESAFVGFQ